MHNSHVLFPAGKTKSIALTRVRSRALVVLQPSTGARFIDHPVGDAARYSTLMVPDGEGNLGDRLKLRRLVKDLMALPGVTPPELNASPDGYIRVPLLRPDAPDGTNITSWTISSSMRIDQIGAQRAYLYLTSADEPKGAVTRDLLGPEWWTLIRALVSLEVWMTHLAGALDELSNVVRNRCLPRAAKQVRILHHTDGLWREVFAYEEIADQPDLVICDLAFDGFNMGEDERAAAYRAKGLRSLSVGDAVVIDNKVYLCKERGWSEHTGPLMTINTIL
ncbi:hypothetical protein [Alloactinosynnema sp. L-07]|uniref:hypothetical protein n=1 Tax=Alloactinosynnema sp. L-07 TaxID=1653480 RepID=UPI00065EFAA7|nr:hypothetical protein [Alloactinosynnema sp. L-07]CRK56925.1 hypothetical protein [Alloactinosynnema sp. L-07]